MAGVDPERLGFISGALGRVLGDLEESLEKEGAVLTLERELGRSWWVLVDLGATSRGWGKVLAGSSGSGPDEAGLERQGWILKCWDGSWRLLGGSWVNLEGILVDLGRGFWSICWILVDLRWLWVDFK